MKIRLRILAAAACAVLCSIVIILPGTSRAQPVTWGSYQFSRSYGYISSIWATNPQTILIGWHWNVTSSDVGMVMRSTDGGATWNNCTIPSLGTNIAAIVTDIWFMTPDSGWLTISGNLNPNSPWLWRTVDSGKTWTAINFNFGGGTGGLVSVRQTDSTLVVSEDVNRALWVSLDTGKTWTKTSIAASNGLAFDHLLGVATEFNPPQTTTFLTTTDGGRTWANSTGGFQHEAWGIHFIPNADAFIVAPENVPVLGVVQPSPIYRSTSFGHYWSNITPANWQVNTTGDIEGIQGVLYIQNSGGITGPAAGFYESTDAGLTWSSIGGPSQGRAGSAYRGVDTRFAVSGCGNIVYASDDSARFWKTLDAPGLKFIDSNVMRPITSTICDTTKQLYFLHNINTSPIIIQDIRILDSNRRPAKTHAVWIDSLPPSYMSIQVGDSIAFKLGWHPGAMMDSTASDSATIRVIYYASYLGPCSEMKLAYDTVTMTVKLNGISVPATYTLSTMKVKTDTLTVCQKVDTTIDLVNFGCDTLRITQAMLAKNAWTLTDTAGNALKLPIRLLGGDSIRLRLRATPTSAALLYDSLEVKMHYEGRDTLWGAPLRTWSKMPFGPLSASTTLAFDSLATCDSTEDFVSFTNTGCDTLFINTATLADPHFHLLDANGVALKLPLAVPQDSVLRLMVRFVPQDLGAKNGTIKLVYKYFGFDSSNVVTLSGTGASSGTLSYSSSVNFGTVSICQPSFDTVFFRNTSCDSARLLGMSLTGPFVLLDSANLPEGVSSGKTASLIFQYQPSRKGLDTGSAHLRAWTNNGQTGIDTTILLSGTGGPGTASFATYPQLTASTFAFAPRTQCDHTDSVSFYIHNGGCDTLMLTGLTLDASIASVFDAHATNPLPVAIAGYDSIRVTVGIVDLLAGNYNGNLDIQYRLPDGTTKDSMLAVSVAISQGSGGATTLSLKSPPTENFGSIPPCSSITDTTIAVTYDSGCGTIVLHDSLAGTGFMLAGPDSVLLSPGSTARIRVAYDGSSRGNLTATLYLKAIGVNLPNVEFAGTVKPVDSVHFHIALSSMPVAAGGGFTASLVPDLKVSGIGLHSIHGEFVWRADNFEVSQGTMSAEPGMTLGQQGPNTVGTLGTYSFDVTNSNDIPLDPSTPVVTLPMVMMVSDTPAGLIAVDSIRLNESDPTFSECTLASTSLAGNSSLALTCGDSTLMYHLEGHSLLLAERPRPNPVTNETGYQTTLDLTSAIDGTAEIMLYDGLGRLMQRDAVSLTHGETQPYTFKLASLPAGNYHYELLFSSTSGTGSARGSLLLVK